MHKLLAVILASTVLSTTPNIVYKQTAEARSLFESLFPGAAKRRRQRIYLRRQREQRYLSRKRYRNGGGGAYKSVVRAPAYKTYIPTSLKVIAFSQLAGSFSAHEQKILAAAAAPKPQPNLDVETLPKQINQPAQGDAFVPPVDPIANVIERNALPPVVDAVAVVSTGSVSEDSASDTVATAPVANEQGGETEKSEPALPVMRLSAGHGLLKDIKLRTRGSLGKALIAHYKSQPEFIWIDEQGKITERAHAALRVLADAESYGLRTEDYALPLMTVSDSASETDLLRAAMTFEFSLTSAALRYMADAQNGLVDPNRISGYHDFANLAANYKNFAAQSSKSDNPAEVLNSVHPRDSAFDHMRSELAQLRKESYDDVTVEIAPKTFVRPGDTDFELENIVESIRLNASDKLLSDHFDVFAVDHQDGLYSEDVVDMVRDFQRSVGLRADGIVGRKTIAKMAVPDPKAKLNKVLYAMERMRWLPDRLGDTHVFINQPAYRATYMRGGRTHLSMRAIVGKPSNQTNFFHDKIEYVEYNPYWGVPRSILVNEMLPKLRNNPGYLDNLGYEVTTERGRRISSYNVDWWSVGANFPFNVRQPPGAKNALGELKIMFPNKHSIYMHDTPAKQLFKKDKRAFSHGCVRLADPRAMAAAVLGTNVSNVASRLAGGRNKKQQLPREVPVYVSYFTAWPDANGKVQFYSDMYGRDKALKEAMRLEADVRERASNV